MKIKPTSLAGVLLIEPKVFDDDRGFFFESYRQDRFEKAGLPGVFVQDNVSLSRKGVLRGLHYQHPKGQGKLVCVPSGKIYDVAVDIRTGSPTFGQWVGATLSGQDKKQMWIPPGFAHGFVVLSREALVTYKCTDYYDPGSEGVILWNDPLIGIDWPMTGVRLSKRDQAAPRLDQVERDRLPVFEQ